MITSIKHFDEHNKKYKLKKTNIFWTFNKWGKHLPGNVIWIIKINLEKVFFNFMEAIKAAK